MAMYQLIFRVWAGASGGGEPGGARRRTSGGPDAFKTKESGKTHNKARCFNRGPCLKPLLQKPKEIKSSSENIPLIDKKDPETPCKRSRSVNKSRTKVNREASLTVKKHTNSNRLSDKVARTPVNKVMVGGQEVVVKQGIVAQIGRELGESGQEEENRSKREREESGLTPEKEGEKLQPRLVEERTPRQARLPSQQARGR